MSGGVSIEYAHARVSARLGARPDERLWQQLRASRRLAVLLDTVRASPAASYVSGVEPRASTDGIELAFRQQFRLRVDELAQWAPDDWVDAVRWVRVLIDLPALVHLATSPALPWMRADPVLGAYAGRSPEERRSALSLGPAAPIAQSLADAPVEPKSALHGPQGLPAAVQAWERHWRALWPKVTGEERGNLDALAYLLRRHAVEFGRAEPTAAGESRLALAARLSALLRRSAAQPAALFAWLALLALDLERLRGVFVTRALEEARAL